MSAPADRSSPDAYLQPYRDAVERFGPGFEATLWSDRRTQLRRFDVKIDLVDFADRVILDAGCGPGDFAARLHERGVTFARYVGIDGLPEMIERAASRGLDRCEFHVADIVLRPDVMATGRPDYVCFSGSLNTMDESTARAVVDAAFRAASRGVVFNFLSDRPHPRFESWRVEPARRFNTVEWIDWSLNQSPRVAFRQDYLDGHDATILIEH